MNYLVLTEMQIGFEIGFEIKDKGRQQTCSISLFMFYCIALKNEIKYNTCTNKIQTSEQCQNAVEFHVKYT